MAITSAFQADDAGSIPAARSNSDVLNQKAADIAQLVERTLGKGEVPSSNPGISTISVLLSPVFNYLTHSSCSVICRSHHLRLRAAKISA